MQTCLQLCFLCIFYAFVLQNKLYGSLLQNRTNSQFFSQFLTILDGSKTVFSLLKEGKFFTDQSARQLVKITVNKQADQRSVMLCEQVSADQPKHCSRMTIIRLLFIT